MSPVYNDIAFFTSFFENAVPIYLLTHAN